MEAPTPEDELLLILLRNLRNAAATFGEGTPPYESIRTIVEEHLQDMRKKGLTTNLAEARKFLQAPIQAPISSSDQQPLHVQTTASEATAGLTTTFANLAFRPKPAAGR